MEALNDLIPHLGDARPVPWPEARAIISLGLTGVSGRKSQSTAGPRGHLDPQQAEQILQHVRDVVLIVGRDRKIHFLNHAAERLLARKAPLRARAGRLEADSPSRAVDLGRIIDSACANGGGQAQVMVIPRDSAPPLALTICCLKANADAVLLVGSDLAVESQKVISPLMRYFGLTRSEAEVAASIAAGVAISRIAERRGVRLNTVRTQVKAIAGKLGCTRQSQIAAVVKALPIAAGDPE